MLNCSCLFAISSRDLSRKHQDPSLQRIVAARDRRKSSSSSNADEGLAEVSAGQHSDKGLRRCCQPLGNVLAIPNFSGGDQRTTLFQKTLIVVGNELGINETADQQATPENRHHGP